MAQANFAHKKPWVAGSPGEPRSTKPWVPQTSVFWRVAQVIMGAPHKRLLLVWENLDNRVLVGEKNGLRS